MKYAHLLLKCGTFWIVVPMCVLQAATAAAVGFTNQVEDGEAEEDERCAQQRSFEVAGIAVDEDGGGAEDEDGGKDGISPDAVGTGEIGATSPIYEDRGGGEHVEEPLCEDGEFEVLLELGEEKKQHGREQSLDDEGSGWGLEAWLNMREL